MVVAEEAEVEEVLVVEVSHPVEEDIEVATEAVDEDLFRTSW